MFRGGYPQEILCYQSTTEAVWNFEEPIGCILLSHQVIGVLPPITNASKQCKPTEGLRPPNLKPAGTLASLYIVAAMFKISILHRMSRLVYLHPTQPPAPPLPIPQHPQTPDSTVVFGFLVSMELPFLF